MHNSVIPRTQPRDFMYNHLFGNNNATHSWNYNYSDFAKSLVKKFWKRSTSWSCSDEALPCRYVVILPGILHFLIPVLLSKADDRRALTHMQVCPSFPRNAGRRHLSGVGGLEGKIWIPRPFPQIFPKFSENVDSLTTCNVRILMADY